VMKPVSLPAYILACVLPKAKELAEAMRDQTDSQIVTNCWASADKDKCIKTAKKIKAKLAGTAWTDKYSAAVTEKLNLVSVNWFSMDLLKGVLAGIDYKAQKKLLKDTVAAVSQMELLYAALQKRVGNVEKLALHYGREVLLTVQALQNARLVGRFVDWGQVDEAVLASHVLMEHVEHQDH